MGNARGAPPCSGTGTLMGQRAPVAPSPAPPSAARARKAGSCGAGSPPASPPRARRPRCIRAPLRATSAAAASRRCCGRCRWACGRRTCGTPRCHRRMLRLMRPTALSRHLPDRLGQAHGPGGRGVSFCVPGVRWRHPAHRIHHRSGPDPEDPDRPRRTAQAAARLSRTCPAHRLGRARPGPRRPGDFSGTDSRAARHRHP